MSAVGSIPEKRVHLVFFTGGVISSLGKGIAAASLGNILKARGYTVGIMKLDPYINIDPGTMSPYQHGEVYVTADGAETDLDLGHYERFLGNDLTRDHNVTTGQIYDAVIRRERAGDYLGKTVQVIPHVTDEIKSRILRIAEEFDILIVEIGGTVGDIESLPFLEAARQIRRELFSGRRQSGGRRIVGRTCYTHLTLVPFQRAAGEMKTKPTQHSVAALRQIGINPHIVVCRSETPLENDVKDKIALFADLRPEEVISLPDVDTIYRVPVTLCEAGFDRIVLRSLDLPEKALDMSAWKGFLEHVESKGPALRVGVVGKYVELKDAYKSVAQSLVHAAAHFGARLEIEWIDSEQIERGTADLDVLHGMIVPGGFGERGVEGKIDAIRWARENGLPFLGICLGLQCAVIEYARNVCGMNDAHSVEFNPDSAHPVVHIMASQKGLRDKGGTMRLGSYKCQLQSRTRAADLYARFRPDAGEEIIERHRHRYEVNNAFRDKMASGGLVFSGLSPDGALVEIIEIPSHPYFVATQFHPEFLSRPLAPHPLFLGLIDAARDRAKIS